MNTPPNIVLSRLDVERLEKLLDGQEFAGKEFLEQELSRATVVEPPEVPPDVVTMNSRVHFRVDSSGKEFSLTLVYPRDADGSGDRISILAPVGSALLGLGEGDRISWPGPGGATIDVTILKVDFQPERSGDYSL